MFDDVIEILHADIKRANVVCYLAATLPMYNPWIELASNLVGRGRLLRIRPLLYDQVALGHFYHDKLFRGLITLEIF